jgi:hypothetical protein
VSCAPFAYRLEQADQLWAYVERARKAGYSILIEPTGVVVTHPEHPPQALIGRDVRDEVANALNPIVNELDLASEERLDLLNRLVAGTEPHLSAERDLRERT